MKYKMIALDLDGTLFNDDHLLSKNTIEYLKKVEKRGIKVIISTGRSYSSLKPKVEALELKNPVVCYNGSMIRDGKTDEVIVNYTVPKEISNYIIKLSREKGIHFHGFVDGNFLYEKVSDESKFYQNLSGLPGKIVDFDKEEFKEFTKCMLINDHNNLLEVEKELKTSIGGKCYIAFSKPNLLEIMNLSASKAKALAIVAKDLGIKQEEIIAFGDGLNDMEMLEFAGRGVCMQNSFDLLKTKFEVTKYSNNEDGVIKHLEMIFNEK